MGKDGEGQSVPSGWQRFGSSQPTSDIPAGQIMSPGAHTVGQVAGHSTPLKSKGPLLGMQVAGIGQPLGSMPPEHIISSGSLQNVGQTL